MVYILMVYIHVCKPFNPYSAGATRGSIPALKSKIFITAVDP